MTLLHSNLNLLALMEEWKCLFLEKVCCLVFMGWITWMPLLHYIQVHILCSCYLVGIFQGKIVKQRRNNHKYSQTLWVRLGGKQ